MRNVRFIKGDAFIVVTSDDAKFFSSSRIGSSAHENLQRGKACLGCRRRKMRCDGLRPICTQCSRRNRTDDCEYTDSATGPTRTQILEETLARLQARVKELERPSPSNVSSPTISLHDPYAPRPSSVLTIANLTEIKSKPTVDDLLHPIGESRPAHAILPRPDLSQTASEPSWWELDEPPSQIANTLMRLFLPNSHQLGFALHVPRFLKALADPSPHTVHPQPCLMNAIYLWALRLSRDASLQLHESTYLQRSIVGLQNVLSEGLGEANDTTFPMRVLHVMQAEVLVAQYLFTHGRLLEGRYHANAAVSLAVSYGLHRISPASCGCPPQPLQIGVSSNFGLLPQVLPPVKTCVEFGELLNVFWSVFNIDRCWSVVGSPCIMDDDPVRGTQIDTLWPWDMHEYEIADTMNRGTLAFSQCDRTVQRFLSGESPADDVNDSSFAALRVKASAIYGRVSNLVMAWKASQPDSAAREIVERDMVALSGVLSNFTASLPAVEHLEERVMSSDARRTVYVVNTIAYTSVIALHEVWAEVGDGNQVESDICLDAARQIARVPKAGVDVGLLDPVLGTAGMTLASLYVREVIRARNTSQTSESVERLKKIEAGMEHLKETAVRGKACPVYGLQVPKILGILAVLEKR